jgi:hypothetical protein
MKWYYSDAGQQAGPIEDADFQELVRRGMVRDDTPVWREGMGAWAAYATVKPAPPAPQATPHPAPPAPAQPQPKPAPAPAPAIAYTPQQFVPPAAAAALAAAESGQSGAFFFYPVLKALKDGRVIRRVVVLALQIVAVLAVLGGLLALVLALGLSGGFSVAGLLIAIFTLIGALCAAQVFWYRAGTVRDLEEGDFTVIPVVSILFRMFGETSLAVGIASSIGVGLAGVVSGSGAPAGMSPLSTLIPGLGGGGLVGGLIAMVAGCIFSFFSLLLFYFLAESTLVAVDIAQHVRTLVRQGEHKK